MARRPKGKIIPITVGRQLVAEILHHAKKVPSLPLARDCRIPALVEARCRSAGAPSWVAIFMKAYGLIARDYPELRRAYLTFPYHRIYEHPCSECSLLVEREWQGEPIVLGAKIVGIEDKSLAQLDADIERLRTDDVWNISDFRQLLRMASYPKWLRRFGMWQMLNWNGPRRARRAGTFMISSLGNFGVEQIHPQSPLTTYFTFGPIQPDGKVTLKIIYDHRVMDGRCVSAALVALERKLNTTILDELQTVKSLAA